MDRLGSPRHMLASQCDRVLGHHSFASGGVSSHEYRISHLQVIDCFLLEGIQFERVLLQETISGTNL